MKSPINIYPGAGSPPAPFNTLLSHHLIPYIMIVFTLYKKTGKYCFPIAVESGRNAEPEMFHLLDGFVDTDTAIDASSWCDLATIGEKYENKSFTIVCEEL